MPSSPAPPASPELAPEPTAATPDAPAAHGSRWQLALVLFAATWITTFLAGSVWEYPADEDFSWLGALRNLWRGWTLAVPLMAILVTHELGHYVASRLHRVPASLPFFIPLPLPPFGTMGAIITMRERIRSRAALLDIGAAGPLAGMVVALPVLLVGLAHSPVKEVTGHGLLEGQSLLYLGLKRLVLGVIPPGHDVYLTPTAFAGWGGLLVTALNLIPIGQLDGGHVAYALFGERQQRIATVLLWCLPLLFLYNLWAHHSSEPGMIWLVWFVLLYLVRRFSGTNHPPTDPGRLGTGRRVVAVVCLLLFVLIFMPTPLREY